MLTLHISKTDIDRLKYERYSYPCALVQKRLHVLYMKGGDGLTLSHETIGLIAGVHRDTVTDYIRLYNEEGLEGVCRVGYGTNKSELEGHAESLLDYFEKEPPHTIAQAVEKIEERTGIRRSPTQVRAWMKRHKMKYRKTGQVPAKADKEAQGDFMEGTLAPLIKQAQAGDIHLLFMDAAHFVMGVFLCCLWSVKRIFVRSSSGRKRYNVLGAVNAITKEVHVWTNETYINSSSIVDFFHRLRIYYFDMKPIHIVLDNARYQKCQLVRYIAWQFKIELVYLPSYSPNLNIIERLWKWVKKEALYARYYEDFNKFKSAIDQAVNAANGEKKDQIKTLLSLKFQLF